MAAEADLTWPVDMTAELAEQSHALIGAVTALGGAIGWMSPPSRAETTECLAGVLASAAAGDGAMCTAWLDGWLVAMGVWRREEVAYFRHMAELLKIMVHPHARGRRLGRRVTEALIASVAEAGIETLHLGPGTGGRPLSAGVAVPIIEIYLGWCRYQPRPGTEGRWPRNAMCASATLIGIGLPRSCGSTMPRAG